MSKPDWVGNDPEKLELWGAAVKLQIPFPLLAHEESTRGFVRQPLGGKDKILIPSYRSRLSNVIPFSPISNSMILLQTLSDYHSELPCMPACGAGNDSVRIFHAVCAYSLFHDLGP